jgi:hypothetical protein
MSEIRSTLERIERRVSMPEPAMERLLGRHERRERNARIAAAVVGLGVAAAGVVGAYVTLRVTGGTHPPSAGTGAAAAGGRAGFVIPTVVIWTAIVVIGLTVLAAVRRRARLKDVDVDVEQEGRGPGGAAASARRPAAGPATAPRKGGSDMDSKPKTGVGIPQAEMPQIRFDDGKLRRTNRWLIGAVVVLALAVVALGVALIASSGEETTTPTPGLAAQATVRLVDDLIAASNKGDAGAVAALFLPDAVMYGFDAGGPGPFTVFEGRSEIRGFQQQIFDAVPNLVVERVSPVIQVGDLTSFMQTDSNGWDLVWVLEVRDGRIARAWGMP